MKVGAPASFGAHLKALRETAGFTQEELATIAGLSVHAVSALERGERRRPHVETVRALCAALDLTGPARNAFMASARTPARTTAVDELSASSLPLPLTGLIGRDAESDTLRQWLADPASRIVTLIGPGGVGKTRLALELAREIAEGGDTRVVFVPLVANRESSLVAPAIAEALGLSDVSAADLPRRARVACGDLSTLLVLDNFEQVLDAAGLIAELLASAPPLRVLVTSRAPLRVRGEREYPVGPLSLDPLTEDMPLADLARVPAVRLFVERVRDGRADFRLTPANARTVAAICRRLDALPLALELAAPWIKVLTPDDLLGRLTADVLRSTPGPRDLPERQRTIDATVAWSYHLLDTEDRRAFRSFGILPGRFSLEAGAAVMAGGTDDRTATEGVLGPVARLIDKSLLARAESSVAASPLYYMLETVRAYAAHELAAAGQREDALEGLVRYCTRQASLAKEGLEGPAQVTWLDRVREDLDNYRVALTWLVEQRRADEAAGIAFALLFFWLIRGRAAEGLHWYEQILGLPSITPAAEARALLGAAGMSHTQGEGARARELLTRGLDLARTEDDLALLAQGAWMFGHVEFAGGNLDPARRWFTRSLEGFQPLGIPWGIGCASSGLAWVALSTGDESQADRLVSDAMAVHQPSGELAVGPWFLSLGLYIRVLLALRRGSADQVLVLMRQSLRRVREAHDRFAVVYGLVPLAVAAALKDDHAWVARILGVRDAISERTGSTLADPFMRDLCERTERDARARLGVERWAQAYATGRKASIDAMLADIDNALA